MGGGQQSNPAQDSWQQYQQQQTYKDLGNSLSQGFQRAGASVAGANSGLSGQVASAPQAGGYPAAAGQAGPSYGASGPLFAQQGASGGIDQQQLAQILRALGYGG
jgi:hypothetical protein